MARLDRMTDEELDALVDREVREACREQGLPLPPNDPVRAAKVARLAGLDGLPDFDDGGGRS